MTDLIQCDVCQEWCHGLPGGIRRCLKHLPEETATKGPGSASKPTMTKEWK